MTSLLFDLERAAQLQPTKTAVADQTQRFSFSELRSRARAIGAALRDYQAQPVGVLAHREAWTPCLFFGVLYAGAYYVPIDPNMPAAKQRSIIENAGIRVVLGSHAEENLPFDVSYLQADSLPCSYDGNLPADTAVSADTPLYMIYTSGATGTPKGVLKTHGAMRSYIDAFVQTFPFSQDDVIGNQTPFCFDASAKDLYLMLKCGITMEILPTELFSFPIKLVSYMNERRVSYICWVPSALSIVSQLNTFSELLPQYLRRVFFVGEVFAMKQLNRWRKALPQAEFVNLYGQSELAGICCYYPVRGSFEDTDVLPIGKPLQNCRVFLMAEGKPVTQAGCIGELHVSTPALAACYFGDAEKTAQAFYTAPDGSRVFKTGDLASYDAQGNLVFAARKDHQIKHMGHRIELGEIEAAANALPQVQESCCVYQQERQKIVLFCCIAPGCEASAASVRQALRQTLSSYMLPQKVIVCDALAHNANGKLDREAMKLRLKENAHG